MRLGGVVVVLVAAFAWVASASAAPAVVHPPRVKGQTNATSSNWAGYAASGSRGAFSSVSASWTVPTAADCTSAPNSYSAFWVGLDGYSGHSVEQIGTESDCRNGTATYSTWYEMYPKRPVTIASISAGDTISASVTEQGKGEFTLSITVNSGTPTVIHQTFRGAKVSSAEVIAEAPSYNPGPFGAAPLTDFGTVYFTDASFTESGTTEDFTGTNSEKIDMVQGGTTKALTSDISSGAFSVAWQNS